VFIYYNNLFLIIDIDINWDDLNLEKNFSSMKAYQQSKLANVLFSMELAKRFKDDGITCKLNLNITLKIQ